MKKVSKDTQLVGYFGVDSGQVMIGDPGYLDKWKENEIGDEYSGHYSWAGACASTDDSFIQGGVLKNEIGAELAVVTRTGLGDGVYPVIAHYVDDKDWGRRIARLEIVFIPEDEIENFS